VQAPAKARLARLAARYCRRDIHEAAFFGDVAAVQDYLIADASCVNKRDRPYRYDWTLYTPACFILFVTLLSCSSATPLHSASSRGRAGIVELLLLCHADIDAKDDGYRPTPLLVDSNTILMFCCILFPKFALIISFSFSNETPLHSRAWNGRGWDASENEATKLLLLNNADANARSNNKYEDHRPCAPIVD
jgi:ankyrin repeat protein